MPIRHSNPTVSAFFTDVVEKAKLVLANLPKPGPDTTAEVRHEDDARRAEEIEPPSEHQGPRGGRPGNAAELSTPDGIDTTECH